VHDYFSFRAAHPANSLLRSRHQDGWQGDPMLTR